MKLSSKILVYTIFGALWCGLAHQAVAVTQNFESMTNGTALNSVPGWQAPADHVIRQASLIDIVTTNAAGYGAVGYTNNQGVESYLQWGFPTNGFQQSSLWTLTGGDVLTQNGGVFQVDVRLTSYYYDGTNVDHSLEGWRNGFWILVGSGMEYETSNSRVVWTNAQGFGTCFVDTDQGDHKIYWNQQAGPWGNDNDVNGTPGWGTSSANSTNWNRRMFLPWNRDTYYTVQLSNIVFSSIQATQAYAVMSIFETANPANVITNGIVVRGHAGTRALMNAPFTKINQIALCTARFNAFDHYDNIMLIPPSGVSTTVLQITSIVRQGNDINLTWMTGTAGGQTNAVQVTSGDLNGNYATNSFADIASVVIPSSGIVVTNYLDAGGATNRPSRFYRIRLVP